MRDYGKLTMVRGLTHEEIYYDVMVFYTADGIEWHAEFGAHPSAWYMAVSDDGVIVSMQSDPEMLQVTGLRIVGVDQSYGHEVNSILGKIWDGSSIVEPPYVFPVLPRRQFFYGMLLLDVSKADVQATIDTLEDPYTKILAQLEFDEGTNFERSSFFVVMLAEDLGITHQQLDDAWKQAAAY